MKNTPALLALRQSLAQCEGHALALQDALSDMQLRRFDPDTIEALAKDDRRLLDQFAYRYTRLQDDMGARLMPAALRALGEDVATMPALDRFARLEQLGLLSSAEGWNTLRQIRNEFTHDYPDSAQERSERLAAAISAAQQLMANLTHMSTLLERRFGR